MGMAVSHPLEIRKDQGRIAEVNQQFQFNTLQGSLGIAHSRWATHGSPNQVNAHPHLDCNAQIAIVHNGIIENADALRHDLRGHTFTSDTDSELLAHLVEAGLSQGIEAAVRSAASRIEGRNAFLVLYQDTLIGVRLGSPLIVGVGDHLYIASDIPAFLPATNQVMYVDDGEMVSLTTPPRVTNIATGEEVTKRVVTVDLEPHQAEKGSYPYFLIKEIMEQKDTLRRAINQDDQALLALASHINNAHGTFFIGCGTAGKVCQAGEYLFSDIANAHINAVPASEFPRYDRFLKPETLVVAVSQSGETADVLDAVDAAKKKGSQVLSLVNTQASSLERASDFSFRVNAGPEKAVASTKATTSQLAVLTLLAYATAGKLDEGKRLLVDTAAQVNDLLNPRYEQHVRALAEQIRQHSTILVIGRGSLYPIALESAIKIMEVSQIHAQGFAGGELKHGPLALVSKGTPCVVLGDGPILNNAQEVKARGGYIIGIAPQNHDVFDYWIKVPDAGVAAPLVSLIPIQLLAYYLGVARGIDPDYCRNLAKSVTVK